MARILYILLLSIASKGFAQAEFNSKFKPIPPLKTAPPTKKVVAPVTDLPTIVTPNVFKTPPVSKPNDSYQMTVPNNFSMIPKKEFINPGDLIVEKLNKKPANDGGIVYRKNQNLGDFKTKSISAKVLYRDAEYVDGDIIRVYLNGEIIQREVILDGDFQGFEITLVKGFNKIDFEALNQGSSGPNTAEFQVYDDQGILISASQWNLGTGFKATIVLTKE